MNWFPEFLQPAIIDHLLGDLRYAWRGMRRSPGFYSLAVLMLALGIGINAAIFSVFAHVLLAPLRFPDPGNLYVVSSHAASLGDARRLVSGPDFRDFHDQGTTLSQVAAAIGYFTEPWTGDGTPRVVKCTGPTQQFFRVMGIRPIMGRLYTPVEYSVLESGSVLISSKFWKEQLGGDPHVIGRIITMGGSSQTILLSAAFLLGAIGALACLLPGIRASQLDPRTALNME